MFRSELGAEENLRGNREGLKGVKSNLTHASNHCIRHGRNDFS